jgi:uncharacterized protein YaiI (UPF0178 family)
MSALALRIAEAEEAHADAALLALSRLRDLLVRRDANLAACLIDDAIHAVEAASREPKA